MATRVEIDGTNSLWIKNLHTVSTLKCNSEYFSGVEIIISISRDTQRE